MYRGAVHDGGPSRRDVVIVIQRCTSLNDRPTGRERQSVERASRVNAPAPSVRPSVAPTHNCLDALSGVTGRKSRPPAHGSRDTLHNGCGVTSGAR